MGKDGVQSIMDLVRAAAPDLSERQLGAIAERIYTDMGGSRPYIPKKPALKKTLRIADGLATGLSLAEAFAAAGVSRATGYRLSARRWRIR